MNKRHAILEMPEQATDFDKIISDERHDVSSINFSSAVVDGAVKHFALVVWHDFEYGEHAW